ncbi:MAG TPA: hypothetical protein PKJ94_06145 [Ferruginibacter sp.]|nr:hypothetical protein [Ferruginibacter sp.]
MRKELRSGVPQGEIKNQLLSEGYSEEEINRIFTPHQYDMRNWYLIFAIVFFIAGILFFTLFLVAASAVMFSVYYMERKKFEK